MSPIARRRPLFACLAALGVALTTLAAVTTAAPVQAAPADHLIITEVYGGGGNSNANLNADFVELYNPTASSISLSGLTLQYRSASGSGVANGVAALSGAVPPASHYLVQTSTAGANGTALPPPDLTVTGVNMAAAAGTVYLSSSANALTLPTGSVTGHAQVVDLVGFGSSNTFETAATPAISVTSSAGRVVAGEDSDNNSVDFQAGPQTPTAAAAGELAATDPSDVTANVGLPIVPFTLAATGGTAPYTWDFVGLPDGIDANPAGEVSGTPTVEGTFPVTATVTDSADPAANDDVTFSITVSPALSSIPIAQIQGDGAVSPLVGDPVITEGVVTAAYPSGGFFGFYMQTEGTGGSVDPATRTTSDGIFVRQTVAAGAVTVEPGDFVQVSGTVTEFAGQTQVEVTDAADIVPAAGTPTAVTPVTTTSWPATNAQKEALEGMLFSPQGEFTVSNTFATNQFGEVGLAVGDKPLIQPTEVADAQSAEEAAVAADNAARAIILDDASSTNFIATSDSAATCNPRPTPCLVNGDKTPPYISNDTPVRVGATGTFDDAVILTHGGSPSAPTYRFEPIATVTGPDNVAAPATFENTRTEAPDATAIDPDGTADLKIASFNVLNYFTTLGDANDDNIGDGGCVPFRDRAGDGNSVNEGCDQRGAWDPLDLARQQEKIVEAINALDADIVGLMEIENSAKLGETADEATEALVDALNADAGSEVWAANPSSADLPPTADMDVITNAIIYKVGSVDRVGPARALGHLSSGSDAFNNAREPIAQAFTPDGSDDPFLVVVNHFKSKGSGFNDGTGQGNANPDRVAQAQALRDWVPTVETDLGVDATFLLGDFNAYTMEDPMQVLYAAGYTDVAPEDEYSYSFSGLSGSLDHIVADAEALAMVTGSDIWSINSGEPLPIEYSRYNYHSTDFHQPTPYRSSDHDPVVVGINTADPEPTTKDIQILGTNDFHGRLVNDPGAPTAGAAVLAGAVKQLRAANPNTAFVAAGDLIGASTFESFIARDKPTIDALNEAGLDVSAAGNHEFDQGYDDLVNRVMAPYNATTNPYGGAEWKYIAANVRKTIDNTHALAPTWTQDFGSVKVGYVGAVTEHLPELVSPAGISEITVTDIVTEANAAANDLKADGADVIVLLVHEGAPGTACDPMDDDPTSDFGSIITGVNDNIDAIVSGHTHLAYNCSFPVAGWSGRDVTERPVVSAGQYGMALNQIIFTVDTTTGEVQAKTQALLPLKAANGGPFNYPVDGPTKAIVDAAVANAETLGAQPLGQIAGPLKRGYLANGTTENRGAESAVGNLVAEVQKWATSTPTAGSAQIAFMNPGGLRADMLGSGAAGDPYPRTLTYRQAANVQPFANTLVNMDLTGAQIKATLEQQWQPTGAARPFLKLGISKGFTYTADPSKAQGSRITGMWLDGTPIEPATVYSVTVNSFLASGGDNFTALAGGAGKQDTGQTDLQAMVDYMDEFANTAEGDPPLPVPTKQNGVGVTFPAGAPAGYEPGQHVLFDVSGWSFTNTTDPRDTAVVVSLGGTTLGTFPLDNTAQAALPGFDETGKASVDVVIPADATDGVKKLILTGATTGTAIEVPVTVDVPDPIETTVAATGGPVSFGTGWSAHVTVTPAAATGTVEVRNGDTLLGTATLSGGTADASISAFALQPGTHTLRVLYLGDATHAASEGEFTVTVHKATTSTTVTVPPMTYATQGSASIKVTSPASLSGTVELRNGATLIGTAQVNSNGAATIVIPGTALPVGTHTLTAKYLGDDVNAPSEGTTQVVVSGASSSTVLTITPSEIVVGQGTATLTAAVTSAGGTPTGTVVFSANGTELGSRPVVGGSATMTVGPAPSVGTVQITATYSGNDTIAGSVSGPATLRVVKADVRLDAEVKPQPVIVDKTKTRLKVAVSAAGQQVTGQVRVTWSGQTKTVTLVNGKATVKLGKWGSTGTKTVKVRYLGSAKANPASEVVTFTVRPRPGG